MKKKILGIIPSIPGRQMRSREEKDGGEDVEHVEDGRGEHQLVEVPLDDRAKGEVNKAAHVSNQPKQANDHLPEKSESEKMKGFRFFLFWQDSFATPLLIDTRPYVNQKSFCSLSPAKFSNQPGQNGQ